MNPLSLVLSFIFGTIIGSFLNVVSLRYNTGMGIGGRSRCFTCGKSLTWKELVPLFSFLIQKGSCKKCKTKISWQYPLVEFLSGVLFVLILFRFPPVSIEAAAMTALYLFITCLMVVVTVYDMKHKIIPDTLVYTFALVAFLGLFIPPIMTALLGSGVVVWPSWGALLAGPVYAMPFAILWVISHGRWIGLGDAKLMLGIGWVLGMGATVSAVALAFWIGAVVSVGWMLIHFGKLRGHYEIPFAPYLILGMYLVLLFQINVFDIAALSYVFTP